MILNSPPSHVNNYRRVPLPAEPGYLLWDEDRFTDRPRLDEWTAPLVTGAISQRSFGRAKVLRPVAFLCYPSTVKVVRDAQLKTKPPRGSKRGSIDAFSERSRRRLRRTAVDSFPALSSQFVLTYPAEFPTDGRESKDQLNTFLVAFRRKFRGVPYLWVLEFQRRGAPHYHLYSSLPVTDENRQWLAKTWVRIGCGGSAAALRFHEHEKNFIPWNMGNGSYVCKYLDKSAQKDVPEGYLAAGRFWGASRGIIPEPIHLRVTDMTAALDERCHKPVTRTVRALVKYHQKVTTWWQRDDNGMLFKKRRSFVTSGRSLHSFTVVSGKTIFLNMVKYFERNERGKSSFNEWSKTIKG